MKQSLSLRFGQQMTMTPQLQQAIRLMQLSAMELNLEIREAVETNPMLELADDDVGDVSTEDLGSDPEWEHRDEPASEMDDEGGDFIEDVGIPEELPVDTSWDDVYQGVRSHRTTGARRHGVRQSRIRIPDRSPAVAVESCANDIAGQAHRRRHHRSHRRRRHAAGRCRGDRRVPRGRIHPTEHFSG